MRLDARKADPIRVVEAAYAWQRDEGAWLDGIIDTASSYDVGGGVIAYTVEVGASTKVTAIRTNATADRADADALARVTSAFPPELARHVCAPTEFVGNCAYRMSRLVRESKGTLRDMALTSSSRLPTMWALVAGSPRRALLLCFPCRRGASISPEESFPHAGGKSLGMIGAHLGASLRLRALVPPSAEDADTEAVLTPDGKLLHADGAAKGARARSSLAQVVLASERARSQMRRASDDEALRQWTALVQGRWTILDTVERDGKRLLLARRNRLDTAGLIDLAVDERDVVWLAALGHSYKYIAYELGVPLSTVNGRLRRAMRKLRVTSRAGLLQKLGHGPASELTVRTADKPRRR